MLIFLREDNRDLRGMTFMPGYSVVSHLENTLRNYTGNMNEKGYRRLCNLIGFCKDGSGISYNELRRLKNWFDHNLATDTEEYYLNGGDVMKSWVMQTLGNAMSEVETEKRVKKEAGISNAYRRPHEKNRIPVKNGDR